MCSSYDTSRGHTRPNSCWPTSIFTNSLSLKNRGLQHILLFVYKIDLPKVCDVSHCRMTAVPAATTITTYTIQWCHWKLVSLWNVSDLWNMGRLVRFIGSCSWDAKLFSDFGRGRLSLCSACPSSCRLRPSSWMLLSLDWLPIDSSDVFTCSACSAKAFTTALIVLLSLPMSSSRWDTRFGFFPILFSLEQYQQAILLRRLSRILEDPGQTRNFLHDIWQDPYRFISCWILSNCPRFYQDLLHYHAILQRCNYLGNTHKGFGLQDTIFRLVKELVILWRFRLHWHTHRNAASLSFALHISQQWGSYLTDKTLVPSSV